jgi:predicted NAD-dependent protein-ADP-ribosyltransferase YbiA (DUF1768 family)
MDDDNVVYFSAEHCLSNYHCDDIVITDGKKFIRYPTGEHALHGEKFRRLGKVCPDKTRRQQLLSYSELFRKGFSTFILTAMDANKHGLGFQMNDEEINAWTNLRIFVQREICQWKWINCPEVRRFVEKTRDKTLIYSDDKMQTAEEDLTTINQLGRIWMFVRDDE